MSTIKQPGTAAGAAIDDARALLDALVTSDWEEIHVATDATEIFIARWNGRTNPMCEGAAVVPEAASRPIEVHEIRAPHVATLVKAVEIGSRVAVGERVATLRVLDEEQDLVSNIAGIVVGHPASAGALLEYGAAAVILEKVA